jgi:uncharacterized protein with GYD domain
VPLSLQTVRAGENFCEGNRAGADYLGDGRLYAILGVDGSSREGFMETYVMLFNFTDQGIRNVKDINTRVEPIRDLATSLKVTVKNIFWTLGQYDMVAIIDAPDEIAATALGLSIGQTGNVRTQTLRAFSQAEMGPILNKIT